MRFILLPSIQSSKFLHARFVEFAGGMPHIKGFDAHEAAPESIRKTFKFFQKFAYGQFEGDHRVLDFGQG